MKKNLSFTILLFIFFIVNTNAQCPQRYRDKVFNDVNTQLNINYGGLRPHIDGNSKQLLADLYEPKNDTASLRPLVFMVHEGGFLEIPIFDRKSPNIVELSNDLAKRGYVAISAAYRLAKDPLALLSKDRMSRTVIASLVDINDFICYFTESARNGNPYRIDTSRLFMCGLSAGAVITLQGLFINDTTELDSYFRKIVSDVSNFDNRNIQEILQNKYCGAHILGGICVSGALLDTNFIKPINTSFLLIHGTADPIIPFNFGKPFAVPTLPNMYGSGLLFDKMKRNGIDVEFDIYPGLSHIPFMWIDIVRWFDDFNIFNEPVLDTTKNHIARFCYRLMGKPETNCNLSTSIKQNNLGEIGVFPNPNNGNFTIKLPKNKNQDNWQMQIFSINGQLMLEKQIQQNTEFNINEKLPTGLYFIKIFIQKENNIDYYLGKFYVSQ